MKLRDEDTVKDQEYRYNIVNKHIRKSSPIIATLLIACIVLLYAYTMHIQSSRYSLGDPYHCSECKNLGIACSEHKDYDANDGLKEKIDIICMGLIPEESVEYIQKYIYNGSTYDKNCDFCSSEHKECYGCSYDREYITQLISEVNNDSIFKSKLCDKCWKLGYANCSNCRAMLADEIKREFNNINHK